MKDDIKPEETKNEENNDNKKELPVNDGDIYERDIDKELERVESIEGGKDEAEAGDEDDSATDTPVEETIAPDFVVDPMAETVAPKPTIEEIIGKQTEKPAKNKKTLGWMLVCVALVLALAGMIGYYFYDKMNQDQTVSNLKTQVSDIDQQKQAAVNQLAALKAQQAKTETEKTEAVAVEYREIPEFGVRYKVTEATKNLIYGYEPTAAGSTIEFTTIELAKISEKKTIDGKTELVFPCSFSGTALGNVAQYDNADTIVANGQSASKLGKKIGEKYYIFNESQTVCSDKMQEAQQALKISVKAMYDSLETIPAK